MKKATFFLLFLLTFTFGQSQSNEFILPIRSTGGFVLLTRIASAEKL